MADKVLRYSAGNFLDPNIDSNKKTANEDADDNNKKLISGVVITQIINKVKNTAITAGSRRAIRSGNLSQADTINKVVSGIGDLGTIATGFGVAGLPGAGLATLYIGIETALEIDERNFGYALDDIKAREDERRVGAAVDNRSELR